MTTILLQAMFKPFIFLVMLFIGTSFLLASSISVVADDDKSKETVATWFEWLGAQRIHIAHFFGFSSLKLRKKSAKNAEVDRLHRIRLDEAKLIAAERLSRELDAKARKGREEDRLLKEAHEAEMKARIERNRLEEEEYMALEYQKKPRNIGHKDSYTSTGCPGILLPLSTMSHTF